MPAHFPSMLRHLVRCVIIISSTVDAVCSKECSGFSSSCPGVFNHFVSQTAGFAFRSHLANNTDHQRQLWTQSSPGSFRRFALLPTVAGDSDPSGSCEAMLGEGKRCSVSVQPPQAGAVPQGALSSWGGMCFLLFLCLLH